jgi:hypothetical protein
MILCIFLNTQIKTPRRQKELQLHTKAPLLSVVNKISAILEYQGVLTLKGLSHEIFTVIFLFEWIYLDLNENRYCFLNFKEGTSILDSYFKF